MNLNQFDVTHTPEYLSQLFNIIYKEINDRLDTPFWQFKLYTKQQQFYDAIESRKGSMPKSLFIAGNKAGKTWCGAYIASCLFRGEGIGKTVPNGSVGWIVGLDRPNMLEPVIKPILMPLLGEEGIDYDYDKKFDCVTHKVTGNRIYFKTCDAGVGKFQSANIHWVWADEEPPEDIYREILPRLIAYNGFIFFTYTPTNGISWSYEELYQNDSVFKIKASMYDNAKSKGGFLDDAIITDYEKDLTEEERAMRINGDYVFIGGNKVFTTDIMNKVKPHILQPEFKGSLYNDLLVEDETGSFKLWKHYDENASYCIGIDTSEGMTDDTAIQVIKFFHGRLEQVAEFNKCIDPELLPRLVTDIARYYKNPLLVIENNTPSGKALIERIKYDYPGYIYAGENKDGYANSITKTLGFRTTEPSKQKMVVDFKQALREGNIQLHSQELMIQMDNFIQDKRNRMRAQSGHDDLVMSMMLALQGFLSLQFIAKPESRIDNVANIKGQYSPSTKARFAWHNQ